MCWGPNAGVIGTQTADELAAMYRLAMPHDATFFPDTCFLTAPLDFDLWQTLLTRTVALTPAVLDELQPWLRRPHANVPHCGVLKARMAAGDPSVRVVRAEDEYRRYGYDYYLPLLMLRKRVGRHVAAAFAERHGRPADKNEFYAAFKRASPGHDDRAARIAWKGASDWGKPSYGTDEQLVTTAVLHALTTGRETFILTRDHDLMEQFYKLVFLIDTHYRSREFAERYAAGRVRRSDRPTEVRKPGFCADRFCGEDDLFVPVELTAAGQWYDLLPPVRYGSVNVSCVWFGGPPDRFSYAEMVFHADTNMAQVLQVKAETGGLNTPLLGGKNCHIYPFPGATAGGQVAAIATDRIIPTPGGPALRVLDTIHALASTEPFDRVIVSKGGYEQPNTGQHR